MALKVILGTKNLRSCTKDRKYMSHNDSFFDSMYKPKWIENSFAKRVLREIDNIIDAKDHYFYNGETHEAHSERDLSTGCKTLILLNEIPDIVFRARYGENCIPFVEELALQRDIIVHDFYTHIYDFDRIGQVEIINYDKIVSNISDLIEFYTDEYIPYENGEI